MTGRLTGERSVYHAAGLICIDTVGLHTGRNVGHDLVRVAQKLVLLVLILVLDTQGPREDAEVMLDGEWLVALVATYQPLAAVID